MQKFVAIKSFNATKNYERITHFLVIATYSLELTSMDTVLHNSCLSHLQPILTRDPSCAVYVVH